MAAGPPASVLPCLPVMRLIPTRFSVPFIIILLFSDQILPWPLSTQNFDGEFKKKHLKKPTPVSVVNCTVAATLTEWKNPDALGRRLRSCVGARHSQRNKVITTAFFFSFLNFIFYSESQAAPASFRKPLGQSVCRLCLSKVWNRCMP